MNREARRLWLKAVGVATQVGSLEFLSRSNLTFSTLREALFGEVTLSPGCALALSWPAQVLRDFSREDLAMIGFQAWLLGMSIVAVG